jgi:uncharacterized membrane protein
MNERKAPDIESRLETAISYLLISGVIVSLLLEVAGVILYLRGHGNLVISHDQGVFIQGRDFFSFIYQLWGNHTGGTAILLMISGVVVLILTPFIRIILSVVYFGWEKNWKYVFITLFVLLVITLSLTLH